MYASFGEAQLHPKRGAFRSDNRSAGRANVIAAMTLA
jgi:hypothetical protein